MYITKWKKNGGAYIGGFRMRVLDEDYDYCYLKSVKYRNNRQNYEKMLAIKKDREHDFVNTDYDCNGSTRERLEIARKGRYIYLKYYWSKNV